MKALLTLFFICTFYAPLKAQTFDEVMSNYEKNLLNTEKFYVDVNYKLYEDYDSGKILEELKGICIKNDKSYYSKIGPTEYLFTNGFSLKISHNEKLVLVTDSALNQANFLEGSISLGMLKNFNSEKFEDKGQYWSCTFIPKASSNLPYKKVVLNISKEGYKMIKQTLYFSSPLLHGFDGKQQYIKNQRLEIEMRNYKTGIKSYSGMFQLATYLKQLGSEYQAANNISEYRVINAQSTK